MGPETVTNGELCWLEENIYKPIVKIDGIKTINEIRREIDLDPVDDIVAIPQNYSIELTGSFRVDDNSIIFDLMHPVKCNCRNCGAPVRLEYCEYCGTPYPTDYKLGMKWVINLTNEEAIWMLEALLDPEPYDQKLSKKAEEAVKMAIEALKERACDPCADCTDHDCYRCPDFWKE